MDEEKSVDRPINKVLIEIPSHRLGRVKNAHTGAICIGRSTPTSAPLFYDTNETDCKPVVIDVRA